LTTPTTLLTKSKIILKEINRFPQFPQCSVKKITTLLVHPWYTFKYQSPKTMAYAVRLCCLAQRMEVNPNNGRHTIFQVMVGLEGSFTGLPLRGFTLVSAYSPRFKMERK